VHLQPEVPETANRDVFHRGATFLEVDLAATHFLAKGAIRKEVELTKMAGGEMFHSGARNIIWRRTTILLVGVKHRFVCSLCPRNTGKCNTALILYCLPAVLAWGGHENWVVNVRTLRSIVGSIEVTGKCSC
jgi:hypothetical protein